MTFLELRNDLGSLINQTDDSGVFVSTFITTAEANRWLNEAFQEVYKNYSLANRGRFGIEATANTVEDQDVYTFGGDANDLLAITWVGIKYKAADERHTRAENLDQPKAFQSGHEKWSKANPAYFERQIYNESSGHYELGVQFPEDCIPDASVTNGLKVMYLERPPKMENDTDIPEKLPKELHDMIVAGASIKAFKKMGNIETAQQMTGWFDRAVMNLFRQEQSRSAQRVKRIKRPKRDLDKFYRYRK